ncbi:MAG: hypothetical protein LBF57_03690 [Holosporaceae bacterium]|jgi:hypoxanthine-DNA glycosylase|nr:hypothetical protein [Holosporaceae bacterium]
MLLKNRIALSDVLQSCDIEGSADSCITNAVLSDLSKILNATNIEQIYANGEKAYRLFLKFFSKTFSGEILKLPSTSPANAKYSLEQLIAEWRNTILLHLGFVSAIEYL